MEKSISRLNIGTAIVPDLLYHSSETRSCLITTQLYVNSLLLLLLLLLLFLVYYGDHGSVILVSDSQTCLIR